MEKTIEIKAIDKEKALKRALNILGVELTENEAVEIVEKVKPRKKFFGLFGTEPGIYEVSIKAKEKEQKKLLYLSSKLSALYQRKPFSLQYCSIS